MKATSSKKPSATNWEKLAIMPDMQIDFSDNPELDASFFDNATLRMPEPKKPISLRLDKDLVDWYKQQGPGYQTRINAVLRMYMQSKTGSARKVPSQRHRQRKYRMLSK